MNLRRALVSIKLVFPLLLVFFLREICGTKNRQFLPALDLQPSQSFDFADDRTLPLHQEALDRQLDSEVSQYYNFLMEKIAHPEKYSNGTLSFPDSLLESVQNLSVHITPRKPSNTSKIIVLHSAEEISINSTSDRPKDNNTVPLTEKKAPEENSTGLNSSVSLNAIVNENNQTLQSLFKLTLQNNSEAENLNGSPFNTSSSEVRFTETPPQKKEYDDFDILKQTSEIENKTTTDDLHLLASRNLDYDSFVDQLATGGSKSNGTVPLNEEQRSVQLQEGDLPKFIESQKSEAAKSLFSEDLLAQLKKDEFPEKIEGKSPNLLDQSQEQKVSGISSKLDKLTSLLEDFLVKGNSGNLSGGQTDVEGLNQQYPSMNSTTSISNDFKTDKETGNDDDFDRRLANLRKKIEGNGKDEDFELQAEQLLLSKNKNFLQKNYIPLREETSHIPLIVNDIEPELNGLDFNEIPHFVGFQ